MLKGRDAYTLAFSPGGRWLAVGYSDATVALWDARTKRLQWRRSWGGEYGEVLTAAFSPDGKRVAFGQANGSENWFLFVYSTGNGKLKRQFRGQADRVTALAFSPQGNTLASGSTRPIFVRDNAADNQSGTVNDYNEVRLWNLRRERHPHPLLWHGESVIAIAFPPGGGFVQCVGSNGTLYVRDIHRRRQKALLLLDKAGFSTAKFSADGGTLATAQSDGGLRKGEVRLWRVRTGKLTRTLNRPQRVVRAVALAPDGHTAAVGYDSGEIVLWNMRSGRAVSLLWGHQALLRSLCFSPDGRRLVSSDSAGRILLWRLKS